MISCELMDLDEIMDKAGILLTGKDYDEAQYFLQESCSCATYKYLQEKAAGNGETVKLGDDERYTDTAGNYGYRGRLTGAWICYTDGAYCDCVVE